jgi:DNA-binding MarR family transcriptional regulator
VSGGLHTRHGSDRRSPGLLLWQVTNRWQAAQRAALKPFGLTHVQFVLLACLTWLGPGGPVSQRRLAEYAATDPMMTSQVVRALEVRGLVQREDDAADRRAKAVSPTPAGISLANQAVVAVEDCDARVFAALGDAQERFTGDLARLAPYQAPEEG